MENGQAETTDAKPRQINLNKCEVWCPYYEETVTVYEDCLADPTEDRPACPFKVGIGKMGVVYCSYSEEDAAVIEEEA